jgi:hypothetical protein
MLRSGAGIVSAAAAVMAASVLCGGCHGGAPVSTGETRHETQSIDLDKSNAAAVEIRMGAGELHLKSGTPKLLDADFTYNVPEWKPVVEYRAGASRGELVISQPKSGSTSGNTVYTWDLKLNGQLPLDITANLGAGQADMTLGEMNLRNVVVNIGAGELKMDLRGQPARDYSVIVHGGVGQATVYLPKDVAIAATASGAIGDISASGLEKRNGVWINPDRVTAPVTVHLDVNGGVGDIHLIR